MAMGAMEGCIDKPERALPRSPLATSYSLPDIAREMSYTRTQGSEAHAKYNRDLKQQLDLVLNRSRKFFFRQCQKSDDFSQAQRGAACKERANFLSKVAGITVGEQESVVAELA